MEDTGPPTSPPSPFSAPPLSLPEPPERLEVQCPPQQQRPLPNDVETLRLEVSVTLPPPLLLLLLLLLLRRRSASLAGLPTGLLSALSTSCRRRRH